MTATGTNSGFGKQLADSEKKVRDRAVRGLVKWLVSNENVDDLQLMKLWKGLFYSFWMSDKPMIQEHLADKLAGLLLKLPQGNAMRYIKAFWTIMVTEWHGIDRLRLDKFYMLLRKFHFYGFQYLEGKQWAEESVREYTRILSDGPLRVNDLKVPDGLRYHTAEVYLEELQRAVGSKIPSETLLLLIEPFFHNLTRSASDVVFARASENVFERILAQKTRGTDGALEWGFLGD
ncbi:hypothetical protein DFJ77DRAFT_22375 [Powellomyces hirtus]|nr:hypothetical protein DFJ77DRAFT_22375 [Powellomyces hirtus]